MNNNNIRKFHRIIKINLMHNAKIDGQECTLFFLEDNKGASLILNLDKGIEYKVDKKIEIDIGTRVENLYTNSNDAFQSKIELGDIRRVTYYKNADVQNVRSNVVVSSPFVLEIIDVYNTFIYVDCIRNIVYSRQGNFILNKYKNTKEKIVYEKDTALSVKRVLFNRTFFKLLDTFVEFN